MKITKEWLEEKSACKDGFNWFVNQDENDSIKVLKKLMEDNLFDWANWTIVRIMDKNQIGKYCIFAAEKVLNNFEKLYPNNKCPRHAIEAAKKYFANPTIKNASAAYSAARAASEAYSAARVAYSAADSAAYSAASAASAANSAASAAYSAASAADSAASAASAAYRAAYSAARAADSAANAAKKEMQEKIINYGIGLLE